MNRRSLLIAVAAPALASRVSRAQPGPWPSRPIRLVVGAPGGPLDVVARSFAEPLGAALGQPVVVENRVGAGTTLATEAVARAAPDGYNLLVSNVAGHAIGPFVYPTIRYDPLRDFTEIALLAEVPLALAVNAEAPLGSLAAFLDAARRAPGGLRVGTQGNGTSSHVTLELLQRLAAVELTHVPYRPGTSVATDLIAGRIEATITSVVETGRNDRLRLLAVTSPARHPRWPEVPTFRESGLPMEAAIWMGLSAPAGLPEPIADRLHREVALAAGRADVLARLAALGASPRRAMTRAEFAGFVAAEIARWSDLVRAARIRAD
ncbi:MAG TPA: tripartite tricarboxylate transporter substrate binding protein [Acetobacteraceae bacterium]|nr:tripartite tricarboxylate transporter substrate binding protein [Acetobacteraceae bacterium]